MKHKHKKIPNSQIELEVSLSGDEFKKYWDIASEKARLGLSVKGFRPGSAPRELTDPLIDKEKVFDEATKVAIRDSLNDVAKDNNWQVIDQPQINVTEASPKGGLKFKTTLTIFPSLNLGDYKKTAKKIIAEFDERIKGLDIGEEEIKKSLDWLRESRATEIRAEREIKEGDLVEVDINTTTLGKPVEGANLKKDKFVVGKSNFVPGFDQKLIGHKSGQVFDFSITAPGDYWNQDLRGKKLDFKVTVHGVFERLLPEVNDKFAESLGPNFKSVDDLKKNIKEGALIEQENREREKMRISLIEKIAGEAKTDIPSVMVERTLDNMMEEFRPMIEKSKKDESKVREELKERAEKNVVNNLVVHAIAKQEKIEPTKEELEDQKESIAPESLKGVDERTADDYIYGVLLNRKVFAFLESLK
jgi:trigger factor